jgi:DNA-binding CsgD family transcriptional regulator
MLLSTRDAAQVLSSPLTGEVLGKTIPITYIALIPSVAFALELSLLLKGYCQSLERVGEPVHSEHTPIDLVGDIYDAVNDETLWPVFLKRLSGTIRSAATNLFVQDLRHPGGAASATFGTDPSFSRSYAEHYGKVNIFLIRGRPLLKTGSVCFSDELCPNEEAIRSEFFNDWVLPQGKGHGLLGTIFNDDSLAGNIGAMRARCEKPFSAIDKRVLQALMPHLQRAVALKGRIAHLEALQRDNSNALDHWSTGVFVVDRAGHVLVANESAAAILRKRDGLTADRNILQAATPHDSASLHRMIRDIIEGPYLQFSRSISRIQRPSGKSPLQIVITPSVREDVFFGSRRSALVFVHDPERCERPQLETCRILYGLTRAEATITVLVAAGKSVREIAEEVTVRENTVRIHLKKIFDKTGTKRQAELVRLVLSGPAVLRGNRSRSYPFG